MVEKGQFDVQPRKRPETCFEGLWDDEISQRFVSFPRHATIFIDDEVWMINVESELADVALELEDAVQAICVPIDVTDDHGLFLRSVNDEDEEDLDESDDHDTDDEDDEQIDYSEPQQINLPRGEYDMLVRIFPVEGEDDDEEEDEDGPHCRVNITFLPRGTIGPKVLKANSFAFPNKLVIHTKDGVIQELPNSAM